MSCCSGSVDDRYGVLSGVIAVRIAISARW
jgi:hypothetical protein